MTIVGQVLGWVCVVFSFICAVALGMMVEESLPDTKRAVWVAMFITVLLFAAGEWLTR